MLYEFDITLSEEDLFDYYKYCFDNMKGRKAFVNYYRGFGLFLGIIVLSAVVLIRDDIYGYGLLRVAGNIAVLYAVWFFGVKFYFKNSTRYIKTMLETKRNKGQSIGNRSLKIQFDNEFCYTQVEEVETKFKISKLQKIAENENAIYLFDSIGLNKQNVSGYTIPKSVFDSAVQKNEFLDFISTFIAFDNRNTNPPDNQIFDKCNTNPPDNQISEEIIIRYNKKSKLKMRFVQYALTLVSILLFVFLADYFSGSPDAILHTLLVATLPVVGIIGAIHTELKIKRWEIRIDEEYVHVNGVFRNKRFPVHDVKRVNIRNNIAYFYSDNRLLFSLSYGAELGQLMDHLDVKMV